jgi:hydroxypyruvate isomerase
MRSSAVAAPTPFRLKYGPHFGMFKHHAGEDLVEQLKFAADQGFTAWEDNGMAGRPVELQERIAQAMARLGITMGVFVAMADFQNVTFASAKPEAAADIVAKAKAAVDVAKRVNAKWTTVVPGRHDVGLEWDYQTANVIDNLKRCVEVFEPAGIVMVLEPLNPWKDHPGLFLTKIPQAYQICRSIGSPACKILFDMYHQQITEGNIIPNIDRAWSEVAYMQIGDNPGRKEPTTGEMNYRNIFRHIHGKGFTGVLGMEHGNAKPGVEGEKALIEAYRSCDSW